MRSDLAIHTCGQDCLSEYAGIPIEFEVRQILDLIDQGMELTECSVAAPYAKDYDGAEGEGPKSWPMRFNLANWGFFLARLDGVSQGGAAVAMRTPGLDLLEERDDLAVLWDLRISPQYRGAGIGTALFKAAEHWALSKGCGELKVETQNINLPACRFYQKNGCVLKSANRYAYPQYSTEIQLLWHKRLA